MSMFFELLTVALLAYTASRKPPLIVLIILLVVSLYWMIDAIRDIVKIVRGWRK